MTTPPTPAYREAALSAHTRRAYQQDVHHFMAHGGSLPTTASAVIDYLQACAPRHNPRTLSRRLSAIRRWHHAHGAPDPTDAAVVVETFKGIQRLHGRPKRQAVALRLADLEQLIQWLRAQDTLGSIRDQAWLLVGFFGALRRSELVALRWSDVDFVRDGLILTVARSKTDAAGDGARCVIPLGRSTCCPVRALWRWQLALPAAVGPVFRRLSKTGTVQPQAISAHHLNRRFRALAEAAGLAQAAHYSAHSLRRGFATEAARLGASLPSIQQHGRWKSLRTVMEYIEAGRAFEDSAVRVLLTA